LSINNFKESIYMIKNLFLVFNMVFFLLLFFACGKKDNNKSSSSIWSSSKKLGQTYYRLALLEVSEQSDEQGCKKSLDYINKALEKDSRPEYLALKGTLLLQLNQEKEVLNYFYMALQNNPDPKIVADILNNKACLLAKLGIANNEQDKIDQSIKIWSKLLHDKDYLTPEVAHFNIGKVYIHQKNYKKAQQQLSKAIKVSPNYLDAHYYLACVSYQLNDFSLARNEISTVLFLEPEHQSAKELSRMLQK